MKYYDITELIKRVERIEEILSKMVSIQVGTIDEEIKKLVEENNERLKGS